MRACLDSCCYNRPYDDQGQLLVHLETMAKLQVQQQIKDGELSLVWSYVMDYENSKNPFEEKRRSIGAWKMRAVENVAKTEDIMVQSRKSWVGARRQATPCREMRACCRRIS